MEWLLLKAVCGLLLLVASAGEKLGLPKSFLLAVSAELLSRWCCVTLGLEPLSLGPPHPLLLFLPWSRPHPPVVFSWPCSKEVLEQKDGSGAIG